MSENFDFLQRYKTELENAKKIIRPEITVGNGITRLRLWTFDHYVTEGDLELGRYLRGTVKAGDKIRELYARGRVHYGKSKDHPCAKFQRIDGSWLGSCDRCDRAAYHDAIRVRGQREKKATAVFYFNAVSIQKDEPLVMRVFKVPSVVISFVINRYESGDLKFGDTGNDLIIDRDPTRPYTSRYSMKLEDGEDLTGLWKGEVRDMLADRGIMHPHLYPFIEGAPPPDAKPEMAPSVGRSRDVKRRKKRFKEGSLWMANHPQKGEMVVTVVGVHESGEIKVRDDQGEVWFIATSEIKEAKE